MAETSNKTRKRKAEDSLTDEVPKSKTQLRACDNEKKKNWDAIAHRMTNYELIQLGISECKKGTFRILPQIVHGVLDIVRARPECWHIQWRHVETEIQQIADTYIDDDKPMDAKKIHRLLESTQSTIKSDQKLLKAISATTLDKSHEEAWKLIEAQRVPLGRVLHHLLGFSRGRQSTEPDPSALVHAMLSVAKLSGFEMASEVYNWIEPGLHDGGIPVTIAGFRALRSQMLRVVLYYEDHHAYLDLMDGIVSALADATKSRKQTGIEILLGGEDTESESNSESVGSSSESEA